MSVLLRFLLGFAAGLAAFSDSDPNLDTDNGGSTKGPDGIVDPHDILNVIGQFGHDCTGPPPL